MFIQAKRCSRNEPKQRGAVLEIRLLERVMRECYVDEQRCEEELKILTQLLSKVREWFSESNRNKQNTCVCI